MPRLSPVALSVEDPAHADELRIDLDPQTGVGFDEVRAAARCVPRAARGARDRRAPEDDGQSRPARLPAPRATLGLVRGARGRGRARGELERRHPELITAKWWKEERAAGLRRLQPERPAQDGFRGVVRPAPRRRPGVDTALLGRGRDRRSRRADDQHRARPRPPRGDPWADMPAVPSRSSRCSTLAARDKAAGLHDAPWPPQYPKQPDEPPRVAPSRAKEEGRGRWTRWRRFARIAYLLEREAPTTYKVRAFGGRRGTSTPCRATSSAAWRGRPPPEHPRRRRHRRPR